MTERRAKLLRIEHQQKFQSIETAEKEANAIASYAKRIAEKNGWSCKAIIGGSQNNPRNSKPALVRNGKRGRPTKTFVAKSEKSNLKTKKPHLHIILYGNPGQTIANHIVRNINKRYRKRNPFVFKKVVSRSWGIDEGYIPYVINQSLSIRQVKYDPTGLLTDIDFQDEVEKCRSEIF
jgi:hypothetical protein